MDLNNSVALPSNLPEKIEELENTCHTLQIEINKLKGILNKTVEKYNAAQQKLKTLQNAFQKQNIKQKIEDFNNDISSTQDKTYPWSNRIKEVLNNVFKLNDFRPKQKFAIDAVLNSKDVLVVMPTGGGKSLIYQLPAYIENGFSVVVSPLISLIHDQIRIMKQIQLNAVTLNSNTKAPDKKTVFAQMLDKNSDLKLIYVTPEWLAKSKTFLNYLQKAEKINRLKRIVIDEVHCCSVWGHDFRPDYQYLGILRTTFSKIPFLGLTATATMNVLTDIQNILLMHDALVITASFNRPNLFYKTIYKAPSKKESLDSICDLLKQYDNQTGIIYCNTVQESINLTESLRSQGFRCGCYHAQMEADQKEQIYNKWVNKRYLFVVATVAFGMGIDIPDVRFVIHYSVPRTIENLYQETGRAGRDGKRADCIIMYNLFDYLNVAKNSHSSDERRNISKILDYCLNDYCCKRMLIFNYFEQEWDQSQCKEMCDYCKNPKKCNEFNIMDYYNSICDIVNNATASDRKLTLQMLLQKMLVNNKHKPKLSSEDAEYIIAHLIIQKYLEIELSFTTYKIICYIAIGKEKPDKIVVKTTRLLDCKKKGQYY